MRAGKFFFGEAGANFCPTGTVRLGTEDWCQFAASVGGFRYRFRPVHSDEPAGCNRNITGNFVHFNSDPVGAGNLGMVPLCRVDPYPWPITVAPVAPIGSESVAPLAVAPIALVAPAAPIRPVAPDSSVVTATKTEAPVRRRQIGGLGG